MIPIGSHRDCASALLQRFGLAPFRTILSSQLFAAVAVETGCAPRRNRPLIPEVVSWLMMYVALQTTSMTQGLRQAWGLVRAVCPWLGNDHVSEEAFTQARAGLTLDFWRTLWDRLRCRYEQRFTSALLWKGVLRVLAVDGSDVQLPQGPILKRFFGCPKGPKGPSRRPQGRLVALCSVLTGFCLDFKLVPLRFGEHTVLRHLLRRIRLNDLLLLDRGFFSLRRTVVDPVPRRPLPLPHLRSGCRFCPAWAGSRCA